jgi:hypothetical protein
MHPRIFASGVVLVMFAACGSDESDGTSQTGSGGSAGTASGGSAGADCDERPKPDAGSNPSDGGLVLDGGNINLDSGTTLPPGRLACYDPDTGAGFDCTLSGQVCCEKKDNCYDPAREPTFCDRPWCS